MGTWKNTAEYTVSIPVFGLNIPGGDTFTVPDEFDEQIGGRPEFTSSKAKNVDVPIDPTVADTVTGVGEHNPPTGPIGVVPPYSAAAAPAAPDHVIQ